jgi:hypothetical protein
MVLITKTKICDICGEEHYDLTIPEGQEGEDVKKGLGCEKVSFEAMAQLTGSTNDTGNNLGIDIDKTCNQANQHTLSQDSSPSSFLTKFEEERMIKDRRTRMSKIHYNKSDVEYANDLLNQGFAVRSKQE